MAYNTFDEWMRAYPKISTSGKTDEEMVVELDTAADFIDSYLCRRYAVPFSTPPRIVKRLELWGATHLLFARSQNLPEWVVGLWEKFIATLEGLRDGDLGLPGVDELSASGGCASSTSGYVPTFRSTPGGFEQVDPNRIEDEDADRSC